jgi:hypothetical protein
VNAPLARKPKLAHVGFVERLRLAQDVKNYRERPSSTFRWLAVEVHRDGSLGLLGWRRYYRTKILAETWAKSSYAMYAVANVKGFL